jgi:hypothetical protein
MLEFLWKSVAVGVGATVLMDLWALLLAGLKVTGPVNWAPVGRWFWHLREGKVFHEDIAKAPPYEHENELGWIAHYAVGIAYGILMGVVGGPSWFAAPTFLLAWIVALVTVSAGWFLLQPGLGLGWAASKLPNPGKARALNLAAHTVFGFGLYATALLIR